MTYVSDMNSEELAAHMTRLQATPGWHNPLDDRLWQEVKSLRAELAEVKGREAVAYQWLDTGHFRKKIPAASNKVEWRPLYAAIAQQDQPQ